MTTGISGDMTHTFAALLEKGLKTLQDAGAGSPALDAQLLLAHALGRDRAYVLARRGEAVPEEAARKFLEFIGRRRSREPLAYITGEKEFYSLDFTVTPDTLIPRPETETIIEAAVELYSPESALDVIDIGAGSGAIAVTLARLFPRWRITAADISPAALSVARGNAARHGVEGRIDFAVADLFPAVEDDAFDLVVSNPPYVPEGEEGVSPEVVRYEPRGAVFAGPDGLDVIRRIIAGANSKLRAGGALIMEIGDGQAEAVKELAERSGGYGPASFRLDLYGKERVLMAVKRSKDG